jgi:hypothetical protein
VVVGVCRITLSIPGNDSLKGKRRVVRRIVDRTRSTWNAAVAEVGYLDEHRRAELGFAVVSNDSGHANSMLDKIGAFVSGLTEAIVLDRNIELISLGAGRQPRSSIDWVDASDELDQEEDEP